MAVPNTERGQRDDAGFSLVETAVVVLILGILLAMAGIVFAESQRRTHDSAAKTVATHGLQAQKTFLTEKMRYAHPGVADDAAELEKVDPALEFTPLPATGASVKGVVYVRTASGEVVELVSYSQTGECFWARDDAGDTSYAKGSCSTPPPVTEFKKKW